MTYQLNIDYRIDGRQELPSGGSLMTITDLVTGGTFSVDDARGESLEARLRAKRLEFRMDPRPVGGVEAC